MSSRPAYRDHKSGLSPEEYQSKLETTSTLYVGNLSFYTTEEQIYELFSMCGEVKRVIMGLDRVNKTPCGFCFVEYYLREEAMNAVRYVSGTKLDDRIIRTDWDVGFSEGRQFGRGRGGGQVYVMHDHLWLVYLNLQVRDEYRTDYDEGRGGLGGRAMQLEKDTKGTYGGRNSDFMT